MTIDTVPTINDAIRNVFIAGEFAMAHLMTERMDNFQLIEVLEGWGSEETNFFGRLVRLLWWRRYPGPEDHCRPWSYHQL